MVPTRTIRDNHLFIKEEHMSTRKIVLTAMFVAIGIALPQAFHLFGGPTLGSIILPMHLPVFVGAMLLGPTSGLIIAILSVTTGMMLGMPPLFIGIYMIFELSTYAVVSGLLYNKLKWNVFVSFAIAKAMGIIVSLLIINAMITFFGVDFPPIFGTLSMFAVGIPGIIIQTILVPTLILILRKYKYSYDTLS